MAAGGITAGKAYTKAAAGAPADLRTTLRHSEFKRELRNHPDKAWHPNVIISELQNEVAAGRVLGPFTDRLLPSLRTSGLGAAAKQQEKWRMILHLSAPYGASVNNGISKEEFSLHYSSVVDAVKLLHSWQGHYHGQVTNYQVEAINYLDDFLIAGAAGRDQCAASVREKVAEILLLVQSWLSRRRASKRELLPFIGKLSFAAKVVPAGHLFLRRLIDLSTTVAKLHHHIRVTADDRADVAWWARFLPSWNGVSMFLDPSWTDADTLNLFTDASGTLGVGAYFDGSWFRGSWLPHQELSQHSIQWQELFAIVAAAHTWGHRLAGHRIRFHCDNLAVVHTWNGQSTRDTAIMVLLRELFYVAARSNFTVQLVHVPGKHNSLADALSRDMLSRFFLRPTLYQQPCQQY
ncbi:hypothetical protein EMCRGX_G001212 [Ephydatia muelleri]